MRIEDYPWKEINTRGLTIVQFKKYMIEKFGKHETERIISTLPPQIAETIGTAKKGESYPFEAQRLLRLAIIDKIDPGDPLKVMYRMGLVTASWDFSTLLKPLFSFISVKTILNRVEALWKKYYDCGKMTLVEVQDNYAKLQLFDFPCDEYFPPIITSWVQVALETLKKEAPRVEHTHLSASKDGMKGSPGENSFEQFELYWI